MEFTEESGKERVVFTDVNELESLGFIIGGLRKILGNGGNDVADEVIKVFDSSRDVISDMLSVVGDVRSETGFDQDSTLRFGEPILSVIKFAIPAYEQNTDRVEGHMEPDQIEQVRLYFPRPE